MSKPGHRVRPLALVVLTSTLLPACGNSLTEIPMQVIEEIEFAASLGIDLSTMKRLTNGSYITDLIVGDGTAIEYGSDVDLTYIGWLTDSTKVIESRFQFTLGAGQIPSGLQQGRLNPQDGGVRLMIIPPKHMYGGIQQVGTHGVVPTGSVMIFEVTLHEVV